MHSVDGEIIVLWNKEEGIPYGKVEVRLLDEKSEVKEIARNFRGDIKKYCNFQTHVLE